MQTIKARINVLNPPTQKVCVGKLRTAEFIAEYKHKKEEPKMDKR